MIRCLINAGPTREYIDEVRFISNPSSGKFGCAIANAAFLAGWDVQIILGPCTAQASEGVKVSRVVSADDMYKECAKHFPSCDIFIACAAVCDMKVKTRNSGKVKKSNIDFTLDCEPTIDILKTLSKEKRERNQKLIGFAAETENLEQYAKTKLVEKNLDGIVANIVGQGKAFESDENEVSIYFKDGIIKNFPLANKTDLAKELVKCFNQKYFE